MKKEPTMVFPTMLLSNSLTKNLTSQNMLTKPLPSFDHQHIDPKKVGIEPTKIKSRAGEDIYAIRLHGPHAEKLKEHHSKFSHHGP
jgi:hypothetical protein